MTFETIEASAFSVENVDLANHLKSLHNNFKSALTPEKGFYQSFDAQTDEAITRGIGLENSAMVATLRPTLIEKTKVMLDGVERDGVHTLGLKEIGSWKINPEFTIQNIKQQAGYAAEVASTYKENLISQANGTGITTFRADDLPELFSHNDQFVDKVRMNADGQIVETIQTKFVGANGNEWVSKMMSKNYDKYFDGKVDKIECPADYFDDAKAAITDRQTSLQKQLDKVRADGKNDVAQQLERRIDKLNQLDSMAEKSTVTSDEAIFARLHPQEYAAKMFTSEVAKVSNSEGLRSGALAAAITFTVSTVDNVSSYLDGEITATEMVVDVVGDTAAAGALGYGTAFISTAVSQTMKASSSHLIQSVGGSCLPAAVVSFAVESYDDISDYCQGEITGTELAYNLGENAAMVAGGIEGAKVGAVIGTAIAGPAGGVVGGIAGGVVGCVLATEAYETAIQLGTEGAELLAEKATGYAAATIEKVSEIMPDSLDEVKGAFNDFFSKTSIKFQL